MPNLRGVAVVTLLLSSSLLLAQAGRKAPSVTVAPVATPEIAQGKAGEVEVHFRIAPGFHINSNTPKSEYMIPTALRLDAPTDIMIGKITYPDGKDMTFPFAPEEKLSVYSGDFTVSLMVQPLRSVTPGTYAVHGSLKYQACDNAACYPPKTVPVDFNVKVRRGASSGGHNPAQSPHAHR